LISILLLALSFLLSMLIKLIGDEIEEVRDADVTEVTILNREEPLQDLLESIFLALVVRVLAFSDAFFVELSQHRSCILEEMLPLIFLLLVEQPSHRSLASAEESWLDRWECMTHWVRSLKHLI
jgi:hypothetical protein